MPAVLAHFGPRTLTEWMARNHAILELQLDDVTRMVDDGELERADHHFPDAEEIVRRRIEIEERYVFPLFERITSTDAEGPTALLRWEHRELGQALGEMRVALEAGNATDFRRAREAFARVESQHRIAEDRLLFPLVDHVLDGNALAELVTLLDNRSTR